MIDVNSQEWREIRKLLENDIRHLQAALEMDQSEQATWTIRGQIRAYRNLLDQYDPKTAPTAPQHAEPTEFVDGSVYRGDRSGV